MEQMETLQVDRSGTALSSKLRASSGAGPIAQATNDCTAPTRREARKVLFITHQTASSVREENIDGLRISHAAMRRRLTFTYNLHFGVYSGTITSVWR